MNTNNTPIHVLLVEDDKINQMIATAFLHRFGMKVTIANDGQEAVILILKKSFHVVLMDLQMPNMDGFEATTIIRSMDDIYFKTVPIIVFTAAVISNVRNQAIRNGVTDLLSKPFEPVELRSKIEEYANGLPITRQQLMDWETKGIALGSRPL